MFGDILLEDLDPLTRTKVLAALVVLLLLGTTMLVVVWLGGRYVRRVARQRPPRRDVGRSDWDPQPFVPEPKDDGDAPD